MSDTRGFLRSVGGWLGCSLFAGFSALGYISLQSLFLVELSEVSGQPTLAFLLILSLFLLTCSMACFLFESEVLNSPREHLRTSLIGVVLSSLLAFFMITVLASERLPSTAFLWLAGAGLFVPALCSGAVFGLFFQILSHRRSTLLPTALLAFGLGSLTAGLKAKTFVLRMGFTSGIISLMLGFLVMAVMVSFLIPMEQKSQDAASDV